ncbi:PASTA domain-containing protein [Nonomuraea sp. NEAU-A123]|uniref:PASTA domain-containing protein n=1 Tax=Nonomuraea sp. NEAU-A123 TaxID=2839649 RepID=UPI001BE4482E|nr:PASTA domain-containing protein [Nonomuraea sp. NEAU-A123]MBT2232201.1 PASTA domain-containing protein [Nonomuraea sp. NEAU-A123]
MSKIVVTGSAIVGLIALGALVNACDERPRPLANAFTTPTATSSPTALPPEAERFYTEHKTMPNLSGRTLAQLTKLFQPVRDTVLVARTADNTLAVGREKVTKQVPKAGAKLAAGQPVKIWITYGTKRPRSTYRPHVPGRDGNRDSHRDRGESRFCSRRWYC